MTPREPDRFEAKEITCPHDDAEEWRIYCAACFAAALRQAEASALERAAQIAGYWTQAGRAIRALIPPAAENAAETLPFNFAEVAANDLLQVDRRALQGIDPEKRRKLAAKLLAGLAAEVAAPTEEPTAP